MQSGIKKAGEKLYIETSVRDHSYFLDVLSEVLKILQSRSLRTNIGTRKGEAQGSHNVHANEQKVSNALVSNNRIATHSYASELKRSVRKESMIKSAFYP